MEQMNYPTRKDFFNAFGILTINEIKDGLLLRTENSRNKYNEIVKDFKSYQNLDDIRPDVDIQSKDRFLGYEEKELIPFTDSEIWIFKFDLEEYKRLLFDFITMEDKGVIISQIKISCKWENDTEYFVKLAYEAFKFKEACKIVVLQVMGQPKKPEAVKPDDVKKDLRNDIFKGNAIELFRCYFENKSMVNNSRVHFRFLFEVMQEDGFIHDTILLGQYIKFIQKDFGYVDKELKSINLDSKPNQNNLKDYNRYKDDLKKTLK